MYAQAFRTGGKSYGGGAILSGTAGVHGHAAEVPDENSKFEIRNSKCGVGEREFLIPHS